MGLHTALQRLDAPDVHSRSSAADGWDAWLHGAEVTSFLVVLVVVLGLGVAIAVLTRLVVLVVPRRRDQELRFRAAAEALGGRFRRSLLVADPELRLSHHGQPVFVTSSFGEYGHEITVVRSGGLSGCGSPGLHLDLVPAAPRRPPPSDRTP